METNKLQIENLNIRINNHADPDRAYNIAAGFSCGAGGAVTTIDSGNVTTPDGQQVASFNNHMTDHLTVNFFIPAESQAQALAAINDFIEAAKTLAASKSSL